MRLSLFFFLHLVAFVILLIVHPHAKAEDDEWDIDDFGNFIVAAIPGEVIHGDKLRFFIKKTDCFKVGMLFSFSTTKNVKNIQDLQNTDLPIKINKWEDLRAARVVTVHPMYGMTVVMMQTEGFHDLDEFVNSLMKMYENEKQFSIKLAASEKYNPDTYFDILDNNWKLDLLPYKIKKAQKMCFGPGELKES